MRPKSYEKGFRSWLNCVEMSWDRGSSRFQKVPSLPAEKIWMEVNLNGARKREDRLRENRRKGRWFQFTNHHQSSSTIAFFDSQIFALNLIHHPSYYLLLCGLPFPSTLSLQTSATCYLISQCLFGGVCMVWLVRWEPFYFLAFF